MLERNAGLYLGADHTLAAGRPASPDARSPRRLAPGVMEGLAEKLSAAGFTDQTVLPTLASLLEQSLRVDGVIALGLTLRYIIPRPAIDVYALSNPDAKRAHSALHKIFGQAALALDPRMDMFPLHASTSVYEDAAALRKAVVEYDNPRCGIHQMGVVDQSSLIPVERRVSPRS